MPKHYGVASTRSSTMSQHLFSMIPRADIPRSVFHRPNTLKTAFNSGYLVPVFVDEALPGDTFHLKTTSFVRMSTPILPLMDNLYLDMFYFFVPIRLIWIHWQQFNGEQVNPGDSTSFLTPVFTAYTAAENSLSDYFGIPINTANPISHVSFWHRAYNLIWNQWFRDENLQNSITVDTGDGPDNIANYVLQRRGKRHDYFTGCLPFTQKGTAVTLPLGTSAPLVGSITDTMGITATPSWNIGTTIGANIGVPAAGGTTGTWSAAGPVSAGYTPATWNTPGISATTVLTGSGAYADLSSATAATINAIRQAFQIQRLLERDARGGSRYTEIIRSHFGVISPDQRLQRPEYLGGGSTRINVHPVARTTSISPGTAINTAGVGALGGFGVGGMQNGFQKSFVEHGVIIGLANVRADLTYQQGVNRMFSRRTRYDFYWPAFAHLGEQSVLNQEIYADGSANDTLVFGYQERYAEYRYKPSMITGTMRSTAGTPMDNWHLAIKFTALPALNSVFIPDQPPMSRVLAVTTQPEFFGDFFFDLRCARPMPTYSVPGMIDHF